MRRLTAFSLALGLFAGAAVPTFATAALHFPNDNIWGDDNYEIDNTRNHPFYTTSNFFYRAKDAVYVWNIISGSGFDFNYQGQRAMSPSWGAGNVDLDETYWDTTTTWNWGPGPTCNHPQGLCALGKADVVFTSGDDINRVLIGINDDDNLPWYQGTGGVGASNFDLWSTMSHEFGHAIGGIDFYGEADCTPGALMLTMCGVSQLGIADKRYPSSHENMDIADKY